MVQSMTFAPADYLARAEAVDPETAAMLRQAARDREAIDQMSEALAYWIDVAFSARRKTEPAIQGDQT
jgi:thymidylate kinase